MGGWHGKHHGRICHFLNILTAFMPWTIYSFYYIILRLGCGQHPCHLLRRSKFESHWLLNLQKRGKLVKRCRSCVTLEQIGGSVWNISSYGPTYYLSLGGPVLSSHEEGVNVPQRFPKICSLKTSILNLSGEKMQRVLNKSACRVFNMILPPLNTTEKFFKIQLSI